VENQKPTWHQEAIAQGIDYIIIVYEKAEGFVFCPSNLENPFRVGGDYNGSFLTNAAGALDHYHKYLNPAFKDRISWFIEFVEKVARNEDFSLDDLKRKSHPVRIIQGLWPW
jgi:hypothetical protein